MPPVPRSRVANNPELPLLISTSIVLSRHGSRDPDTSLVIKCHEEKSIISRHHDAPIYNLTAFRGSYAQLLFASSTTPFFFRTSPDCIGTDQSRSTCHGMAETPSVPPLLTATHTSDGRLILFYGVCPFSLRTVQGSWLEVVLISVTVKALYDYAADNGSEIHFKMGDIIAVTDTPDDGWWKGELCDETRRRRGRDVFPSNYTVVLGPDEEEVVVCTGDCQPTLFYGACPWCVRQWQFVLIATQPRL